MPFIPNRIEAICGAYVNFTPTDPMITVRTQLNEKSGLCAGCSFTIELGTGRTTLSNTNKYRDCLEDKAPIAEISASK